MKKGREVKGPMGEGGGGEEQGLCSRVVKRRDNMDFSPGFSFTGCRGRRRSISADQGFCPLFVQKPPSYFYLSRKPAEEGATRTYGEKSTV